MASETEELNFLFLDLFSCVNLILNSQTCLVATWDNK